MNQEDFEKHTTGESIGYSGPQDGGGGLQFYRCLTCMGVINRWDIMEGGCKKCGGVRVVGTNLSLWEKMIQIFKHPMIWKWGE
jgi:hypothetical protein